MKLFCRKLCCLCCIPQANPSGDNNGNEELIPENDKSRIIYDESYQNIINTNEKSGDSKITHLNDDASYNELCFDNQWMRDDEKGRIVYTKRTIIDLIDKEYLSDEGYEEVHNKDNMHIMSKQGGTIFSDTDLMIRMSYFMLKSDFPPNTTLESLCAYMSFPTMRKEWDTGVKDYILLEGSNTNGLVYLCMKKPAIIISERDLVEKMVSFRANNGKFYSFSSSCNDNYASPIEDVTRITDWFSGYVLSEDNTYFYFKTVSQLDFKMVTPPFILKMTLPMKLKEWYKSLKKKMNKDYNSKEPKEPQEPKFFNVSQNSPNQYIKPPLIMEEPEQIKSYEISNDKKDTSDEQEKSD